VKRKQIDEKRKQITEGINNGESKTGNKDLKISEEDMRKKCK
jgi:hypothetical protein